MNKRIKVTSLTTAALASIILTGANVKNVKADVTTDTATTAKAQTPEDQAKSNIAAAQNDVAAAKSNVSSAASNLDKAKSDAVKPDKAYADQNQVVDDAKKNADAKNNVLQDANAKKADAEKLANEANKPGAIDAAKKDVSDKKNDITAKEQAVSDAQAKIPAAQKAVDDAESDLAAKNTDLTNKQNAKVDADQQVKNAQDALKGTGINEARNAVNVYNDNVTKLNNNINENTKKLEDNKKSLDLNNSGISKMNAELQDENSAQEQNQKNLAKNDADLATAQQQLDAAKELANSAAGFFKSLSEDTSLTASQRAEAAQAYSIVMNEGKYKGFFDETPVKLTWYDRDVHMGKDGDSTSLDNMKAALQDLDDLMRVRDEYKLRRPKISLTAMAISMMTSDYLLNHDFDHPANNPQNGPFFNDEQDIAWNGDQVGLYMNEKTEYIDPLIQQNPSYSQYDYKHGNLTEAQWEKNNSFWASKGLKLSGGGDKVIGHFTSMVNPLQDGVGMAMSGEYGEYSSTDIVPNMKIVWKDTKLPGGGIQSTGKSAVDLDNDDNFLDVEQYKNLVNNYVSAIQSGKSENQPSYVQSARNTVNNLSEVNHQIHNNLSTIASNISKLNNSISSFKSINQKIENSNKAIQNQINADNTELTKQKSNLSMAQQRLITLTASNEQKTNNLNNALAAQKIAETNLANAKTALVSAQNALNNAKNAQNDLNKDIANKQKAVKDAQNQLTQLQNHESALENAPQLLAVATTTQEKAQQEYNDAKKQADEAEATLKKLQPAKDEADKKVSDAQSEYDSAVAELSAAKEKLANTQASLEKIQKDQAEIEESQQKSIKQSTEKSSKTSKDISYKVIRLTHNAFVYDKHGKAIKKGLHFKLIKKGKQIKALKNAKVVTIKGKKFYQISKNEFIKVNNTNFKTNRVHLKARVTGSGKAYTRAGKHNKHHVNTGNIYTFDEKITVHGKTYYKINWTNDWIPASELSLKK